MGLVAYKYKSRLGSKWKRIPLQVWYVWFTTNWLQILFLLTLVLLLVSSCVTFQVTTYFFIYQKSSRPSRLLVGGHLGQLWIQASYLWRSYDGWSLISHIERASARWSLICEIRMNIEQGNSSLEEKPSQELDAVSCTSYFRFDLQKKRMFTFGHCPNGGEGANFLAIFSQCKRP